MILLSVVVKRNVDAQMCFLLTVFGLVLFAVLRVVCCDCFSVLRLLCQPDITVLVDWA